ncbi:uncharacterized protein LOC112651479 isoform X2 [Canis lupus dingo]|uniref:uncharacterized protein LOC112651479 isoform X2 n=1 Tax=Canis lupus dingo TaxID=286419 RepID=UPI000BAA1747|nr:uncharacterized protein LOC112651479 isoform X2 [Canis lupus dingo]|eukprot:XP_022273555.1 formin-like protein 14 isoform X2 [Canis lupus familiaris]
MQNTPVSARDTIQAGRSLMQRSKRILTESLELQFREGVQRGTRTQPRETEGEKAKAIGSFYKCVRKNWLREGGTFCNRITSSESSGAPRRKPPPSTSSSARVLERARANSNARHEQFPEDRNRQQACRRGGKREQATFPPPPPPPPPPPLPPPPPPPPPPLSLSSLQAATPTRTSSWPPCLRETPAQEQHTEPRKDPASSKQPRA